MRRELLLIGEVIEAGEQAKALVADVDLDALDGDRQRRDALSWNFTVLGEAASQLSTEVEERFPEIPWAQPTRLRNRVIHGPGGDGKPSSSSRRTEDYAARSRSSSPTASSIASTERKA